MTFEQEHSLVSVDEKLEEEAFWRLEYYIRSSDR